MILIESSNRKVLIECGLYQSCKSTNEVYRVNNAKFDFRANQIDYVFLCHMHADHTCRTPLIFKRGGTPRIIGVEHTINVQRILLEDSAKIMASDVAEMNKKGGRKYVPIYTQEDVENCLSHYEEYPIGEMVKLDEFISFQFIPSGHIINGTQLILWIKDGNLVKKIAYTSDLGNVHINKFYANEFSPISKCDMFIGETTYAGTKKIATQKVRKKDIEKLKSDLYETCIEHKARLMIPVFAMDRCQNMATHIYNIIHDDPDFKDIPVYIDSPMATKMCKEYLNVLMGPDWAMWKKVMDWSNLHFIDSSETSREIRDSKKPCIVLSSSGMIVPRGRSAGWACSMLPRSTDRIVFCGYSAEGSIGSIIKEGKQKTITISGKRCANKCQVSNLTSFSSHMQRDSLLDYYGKVDAQRIVLVHGDMDGKIEFAKDLKARLSSNNLTTKVSVAQKNISFNV